MKTYKLLFFITISFSIFGMKRSQASTGPASFVLIPHEVQEKALFFTICIEDNPLRRVEILQSVCKN